MIKNIKNRKKFVLGYRILVLTFAMFASFYGIHFFITNVLGASSNASLFILAPVMILSIPGAIFSLYLGYRKYCGDESITKYGRTTFERAITVAVIVGYGVISIFGIVGGILFLTIDKSFVIFSGILILTGIVASLFFIKKLKILSNRNR
jgi:hypothetical protein